MFPLPLTDKLLSQENSKQKMWLRAYRKARMLQKPTIRTMLCGLLKALGTPQTLTLSTFKMAGDGSTLRVHAGTQTHGLGCKRETRARCRHNQATHTQHPPYLGPENVVGSVVGSAPVVLPLTAEPANSVWIRSVGAALDEQKSECHPLS